MLLRFDPFREVDRLTELIRGKAHQPWMPMDAYRHGDAFVVAIDLPGVDPAAINLTVEQDVLTVSAERRWEPGEQDEIVASERLHGRYTRQLFLGENLDADHIQARYEAGVLTLTIPVAEQAKPKRVQIHAGKQPQAIGAAQNT